MLVSVVIPCYNSEHTIDKVVDSCMEEFARWDGYECEMILVNDYSKDGTFRTIQRMAAKYPNVTGISLARMCDLLQLQHPKPHLADHDVLMIDKILQFYALDLNKILQSTTIG